MEQISETVGDVKPLFVPRCWL